MMEIFLSSDGKHTVHLSASSVEESERLLPSAMALYNAIVEKLGTKPSLWEPVMNGKRGRSESNGHEVAGNGTGGPLCPEHRTPMTLQRGKFGNFWSCHQKDELGQWCRFRQDA